MRRKRPNAVYSPGGCGCALLMLPVLAVGVGMMLVLAGFAVAALVLLVVAVGITVWLWRSRDARRAAGKSNTGWIVFLVIAYVLSVPYLLFFMLVMVSTFTGQSVTVC